VTGEFSSQGDDPVTGHVGDDPVTGHVGDDPVTGNAGDDPVTGIRNIGPAQELALARAGIHTATELREIGADRAYARMLRTGSRPHFIGYYVLVMALQGRPWNDCKGAEKDTLRENFDTLVARTLSQGQDPAGIERFLNEIGTGQRR
jgi:DNA transformation protein